MKNIESFWDNQVKRELRREKAEPAKQVHTDLQWREIKRCIGTKSQLKILDAGAGFGRYSIPLAQAGHRVVHLDISSKMIDSAREKSSSPGLTNIEFVKGCIEDLSTLDDNAFNLVLCLDAPLSSCYDTYENALQEMVRVARDRLILSVMNRTGTILSGTNFDLNHYGRLKTALEVYHTGTLNVTKKLKLLQPTLFPSWHAFRPDEIQKLLEKNGCKIERMSAPGTVARFTKPELLKKLFKNKKAYERFLDFEEEFGTDVYALGVGGLSGGLLVTATKKRNKS